MVWVEVVVLFGVFGVGGGEYVGGKYLMVV